MNCLWCSNPESQHEGKEIACFPMRCVKCGYCSEMCPKGVIENQPPYNIINRAECDLCEVCVKECCTNAKKLIGQDYDVEGLLAEILKDKSFYDSSGGGVTFSGGEPLMQHEFLVEMLKACQENGVHTCIETTGHAEPEVVEEVIKHLDMIFMDLKHMDAEEHRKLTGVTNEKILANLAMISQKHDNIVIRIPVIPGYNGSDENIKATAEFVAAHGIGRLELLPYHNLGEVKYGQLGMEYALSEVKTPSDEEMQRLVALAEEVIAGRGTEVRVENSMNA